MNKQVLLDHSSRSCPSSCEEQNQKNKKTNKKKSRKKVGEKRCERLAPQQFTGRVWMEELKISITSLIFARVLAISLKSFSYFPSYRILLQVCEACFHNDTSTRLVRTPTTQARRHAQNGLPYFWFHTILLSKARWRIMLMPLLTAARSHLT